MANAVAFDYHPDLAGTISMPASRGVFTNSGLILFQRQSLPTDPIGLFTLTLTNLIVGSAIHLEATDGTALANTTADAPTKVVAVHVFAAGSPLNNLRIKVRKGSSPPFYQPWETQTTAVVGSRSIYVSQIPDE